MEQVLYAASCSLSLQLASAADLAIPSRQGLATGSEKLQGHQWYATRKIKLI
jgi:hypothetical protein